jgi:hypothetical protein
LKNSENFIIRDYRKGDEHEITSLFREVFGKEMTLDQWNWKYAVPGRGRIYSKVVEDMSHNMIGHAGAVPLRGKFRNKPMPFFQIADVMVHPAARGFLGRQSVFGKMIKVLFEDLGCEFPDIFCYGFPGRRPYILGERIGVYDTIERGVDCLKSPGLLKTSFFCRPLRIEPVKWNDERLDQLWESVSEELQLSVIRDRDYLLWRYADNPYFSYQLLGFCHSERLMGWAVVREAEEEVFVVDLLTKESRFVRSLRTLEKLFLFLKKKQMRLWLSEVWRKKLNGYGLQEAEAVVTNMIWRLPLETLSVRQNLYYTMGDADIF